MAENSNVGDPNLEGAGGNQPPVSQEPGQPIAGTPQSSQEVLELRRQVDTLRKEIGGLQSRQDKGQNEVQSFMAEVKKQMASGKSLEEAEAAVNASREAQAKDDLLIKMARKLGVLDDVSLTAAGNGGNVTGFKAEVIRKAGLDANSADVLQLLQQSQDDFDFAVKAGELKAKKANQLTPSAADSGSLLSASAPAQIDTERLASQLMEYSKQPSKYAKEIKEIGDKLKQAG